MSSLMLLTLAISDVLLHFVKPNICLALIAFRDEWKMTQFNEIYCRPRTKSEAHEFDFFSGLDNISRHHELIII